MAGDINRVDRLGRFGPKTPSFATCRAATACSPDWLPSTAGEGRRRATGWTSRTLRRQGSGQSSRDAREQPRQGPPIRVDGRLDWREWEAKDGSGKRQAVEIIADNVQFLGSRGDGDEAAGAESASSLPRARRPSNADFPGAHAADDDIPF